MADSPPKPFAEQLEFKELGENSWTTIHPPQRMGNALPIAYGGYALATACKAACLSVPAGYNLYSMMGNFLAPVSTALPLLATTRVLRQTRTFATRAVEISQAQPTGPPRLCLAATADFHAPEQASLLTYSRPPSTAYSHHAGLPSALANAAALRDAGTVSPEQHAAFVQGFAVSAALFDTRPCPEGVFAQNLAGAAKHAPHSQEHLPLTARTTADWFRSASVLGTPTDQRAALAFFCDGSLSFCPLSFSHMYLDDSAACSSLDFALRVFGDVDLNQWCLREVRTHVGGEGRSFSEAWIWDEAGRAVACMSQQSILRVWPEKGKL
ncbi:thioesterase-like superfamily-domain-containing protein [Boeremia exigua]|uniref:thioesterase-like superfamily-domain-containing protein n=1 Tax=Boeremia exigua TaxID=749465 RepID=UPI001E8ECAE2|nr:thioesterase-like superfamily-domain-containing protein [Boeremia exigua]KAH6633433.1 thioesterase-like superfamily-domain-containing protein [Boeremia exigua]